jgi:KDO2-lipid IV(A) lauroyltransferase
VERQIAAAFPGLDAAAVAQLARRSYANLGRLAIELVLLPSLRDGRIAALFEEDSDLHIVTDLRARHGRVVAFSGHVGNWELAGAYLAMHGIPLDVVVRRMVNPLFDGFLTRTRSRTGMRVVYDTDAVRQIARGLKNGRVPGLIADQGVLGLASTFVPFFGRPAKTPRGPAVFAIRFDAPIVFCSAMLQPTGKYRFTAEEIPVARSGDRDADVQTTVANFTGALERLVRRYPDQYFWQHRRWKRQPPDTPAELRDPAAGM